MKLVKSDWRTHMREETLSNSLMIKLECPSIENFNPKRAIDWWFMKYPRRPGTSGSKQNIAGLYEVH